MSRSVVVGGKQSTDRGAALIEYLLLLSFIVIACLAALVEVGEGVGESLDDSTSQIDTAIDGSDGESSGDGCANSNGGQGNPNGGQGNPNGGQGNPNGGQGNPNGCDTP